MASIPLPIPSVRNIKIVFEDEAVNIKVENNLLKKSVLKEYFPEGGTLTYKLEKEVFLLNVDTENIFLEKDIFTYYLKAPRGEQNVIPGAKVNFLIFQKIKKYFQKNYSYKVLLEKLSTKYNIKISLRTLSRILKANSLKRRNIEESPVYEIIIAILLELEGSGLNLGYRSMWQRLRKVYGLQVKQKTVMKFLIKIDPEGVDARSRYRLKRRLYSVPGPNFIWHADGYDKLKRYGFAIYGFIDGFSRKLLSLEVSTSNNDPKIIAYYYLKLIQKFGFLPTLIRTDHGTEVCLMELMQMAFRYKHSDDLSGVNSFIKGKSTHNQRIESYWHQFRQHMTDFYLNLFKRMESENMLNVSNPLHIDTLRYCYSNVIKEDILNTKKAWNEHRVRRQNCANITSGIPNELYHYPANSGAEDYKKQLLKEPIERLIKKYTTEPVMFPSKYKRLLNYMQISETPSTAEEAFNLYSFIINFTGNSLASEFQYK